MNEVKLPPLPDSEYSLSFHDEGGSHDTHKTGYSDDHIQAYARAAIEANTQAVPDVSELYRRVNRDGLQAHATDVYRFLRLSLAASPQPAAQTGALHAEQVHKLALGRFSESWHVRLAIALIEDVETFTWAGKPTENNSLLTLNTELES